MGINTLVHNKYNQNFAKKQIQTSALTLTKEKRLLLWAAFLYFITCCYCNNHIFDHESSFPV